MKKLLLTAITVGGIVAYLHGQGTINFGNIENKSLDSAATSNGLVWTNDGKGGIGLWDGMNYNLSAAIYGGPSSDSLTPISTVREDQLAGDYTGYEAGKFWVTFYGPRTLTVPGITPGGTAWIKLELWWSAGGPVSPTYDAAKTDGHSFFGEALFQNPTGNPLPPPTPPTTLTGMPAIVLMVPEPSMFALAGLGLAGLFIFRRRK